jgi:type IV pilus assembly protein PilV
MIGSMTYKNRQQGFSLIEVLVAAVIIAIGLLGLAGLQTRSLQMNQSAHYRSQANFYAYEIVDAMRMNREAARNGDFAFDMGDTAPSGDSMSEEALERWIEGIRTTLPMSGDNTGGSITVNDSPDGTEVIVTVAWFDERWVEDGTNEEKIREVTLETEL